MNTAADLRWLLATARPLRGRLVLAAVTGAAAAGAAVALLVTSGWLITRAAAQPPVLTLTVAIVGVRAFGLARAVLRYLERLIAHDAALRCVTGMRVRLFQELDRLTPAGLGSPRTGDVLSRAVTDAEALQDFLLRVLLPAISAALVAVGSLGLLLWLLPVATSVLLAGLVVSLVVVPLASIRLAARDHERTAELRGELTADALELLETAPDVIAFGASDRLLARLRNRDHHLGRRLRRAATSEAATTAFASLMGGLVVVAILVIGAADVRSGQLSGPELAVVTFLPLALWEVVTPVAVALQRIPELAAAARRLRLLEEIRTSTIEPDHPAANPSRRAAVQARNLTLRWPGAAHPAVENVQLDLVPGTRTVLTGPSGSGKSTVVAALLRFIDPAGGLLEVSDVDVRQLSADDTRRRFAWCASDSHVFDTTIRQNLLVARPDADDAALEQALRAAQLVEWVGRLPDGLETRVGHHGADVSGGERQRLGVARALLSDRPILVLDEPTAHLDEHCAHALAADLARTATARTALVITHRTEQFADANTIVRLGTPAPCPP